MERLCRMRSVVRSSLLCHAALRAAVVQAGEARGHATQRTRCVVRQTHPLVLVASHLARSAIERTPDAELHRLRGPPAHRLAAAIPREFILRPRLRRRDQRPRALHDLALDWLCHRSSLSGRPCGDILIEDRERRHHPSAARNCQRRRRRPCAALHLRRRMAPTCRRRPSIARRRTSSRASAVRAAWSAISSGRTTWRSIQGHDLYGRGSVTAGAQKFKRQN